MTEAVRAHRGPVRRARRVSVRRFAVAAFAATALVALASQPVMAEDEHLMQFVTPAMQLGQAFPSLESPPVSSFALTTPSIHAPGTCMLSACNDPTPLPGAGIFTPSLAPQPIDTQPFATPRTCAPGGFACADGLTIPSQHVADTPDLQEQGVDVPGNELPAFCREQQSMVCLGPIEVPGQTLLSTPSLGPREVTPDAGADLAVPALLVWVPQYAPEAGTVEPVPLVVPVPLLGPIGVVLCESGCPQPLLPDAPIAYHGPAGVVVWADGHVVALPLDGLLAS